MIERYFVKGARFNWAAPGAVASHPKDGAIVPTPSVMAPMFYVGLDGRLMAVSFQQGSNGTAIEPATPVPLFAPRIAGGATQAALRQQYVVSRDGQRFLINTPVVEEAVSPITLVLNWKPRP